MSNGTEIQTERGFNFRCLFFFRTLVVHSLVRIDPPAINLLAGKSRYRERYVMVLRAPRSGTAEAGPTKAFRLDYRRKQTTAGKEIHITVTRRLVRPDIFIASSAPPYSRVVHNTNTLLYPTA